MPEAPEALRHLNNNDSVTPLVACIFSPWGKVNELT